MGGFTILNSSTGEVGTLRTIIFFPSVDPIPTDAHERTEPASEKGLPLKPYPESILLGGLLFWLPGNDIRILIIKNTILKSH